MPSLQFVNPHGDHTIPPLPAGVPGRIDDANKYLNDMGWVAEALGIECGEAEATVGSALRGYHRYDAGTFTHDTLPELQRCLSEVVHALEQGVGESGRKRGPIGDKLWASGTFVEDHYGAIATTRGRTLGELEEMLRLILAMVGFARENNLWVEFT